MDYLRELSRFADVFYLADCNLSRAELAKLDEITSAAWARRHGTYDFGSWSILARDLVGWDRLEPYDEVLLANDSCYLLQPLDDVFAHDGRAGLRLVGPPGRPSGDFDAVRRTVDRADRRRRPAMIGRPRVGPGQPAARELVLPVPAPTGVRGAGGAAAAGLRSDRSSSRAGSS